MKKKEINVKFDILDVVWFLFENKVRRGVIYSVGFNYQSFAKVVGQNIRDLRHYAVDTKVDTLYHVCLIEDDLCTNAVTSLKEKDVFATKKELIASL